MFKQLSFSQLVPEQLDYQEFFWGENSLLKFHLDKLLVLSDESPFIYIWGPPGTGKSHLLQTICAKYRTSIYVPLSMHELLTPKSLENLEQQQIVTIDDIQLISSQKDWEEELFHLFNRIRDQKETILIISGNRPATQLGLSLPDLTSRLQWGLSWQLKEPTDEQKIEILISAAAKKGFYLAPNVGHYLLSHYNRNLNELMHILTLLDKASLEAQRRIISIPFVKETLKPLLSESAPT